MIRRLLNWLVKLDYETRAPMRVKPIKAHGETPEMPDVPDVTEPPERALATRPRRSTSEVDGES